MPGTLPLQRKGAVLVGAVALIGRQGRWVRHHAHCVGGSQPHVHPQGGSSVIEEGAREAAQLPRHAGRGKHSQRSVPVRSAGHVGHIRWWWVRA